MGMGSAEPSRHGMRTRRSAKVSHTAQSEDELSEALAAAAAPAGRQESSVASATSPPNAVLPPQFARILFRTSFISLLSFAVAAALQVYDGMAVTGAVFLCSINYWRKPVYGLRRNVDVCNTVSCLAYQTWRCFAAAVPYTVAYLAFTYGAGLCFFAGRHFDKYCLRKGTGAHALVHLLANVGNVILYVGLSRLPGRE